MWILAQAPSPVAQSADASTAIAIVLLCVVIGGAVALAARAPTPTRTTLPRGVRRVAPAGILGEGTPTAMDRSVWPDAALPLLLERLARSHRLVVAAPPAAALPPVDGRAVFRVDRPADVGAAAQGLDEAEPGGVVVLAWGLAEAELRLLARTVPQGVGIVAVGAVRLPGWAEGRA